MAICFSADMNESQAGQLPLGFPCEMVLLTLLVDLNILNARSETAMLSICTLGFCLWVESAKHADSMKIYPVGNTKGISDNKLLCSGASRESVLGALC